MSDVKKDVEAKRRKLESLIDARNKANCDTRNRTQADIKREQTIEDLQDQIAVLERRLETNNA